MADINATTEQQVYDTVKKNGAIRLSQQPTEAQLRYYAHLVIKAKVRFVVGQWQGRTNWQMSKMTDSLKRELGE